MKNASTSQLSGHKFESGAVVITANAAAVLPQGAVAECLARHMQGDWGLVEDEDKAANEQALRTQGRLFSAYKTPEGVRFWIITECDRSSTTILLPEDY